VASDALTPETARELTPRELVEELSYRAMEHGVSDDRYRHTDKRCKETRALMHETEKAILAAWERDRARLAEVTTQRDALVPLALAGLPVPDGEEYPHTSHDEDNAARAALTAIAAERGKGAK
jgi:hypothetical protein